MIKMVNLSSDGQREFLAGDINFLFDLNKCPYNLDKLFCF